LSGKVWRIDGRRDCRSVGARERFKKRLGKNLYRSLILARGRQYWVYAYLFAKKGRANIDEDELVSFRALVGLYARKTAEDLAKEVQLKELVEIC